MIPKLLIGNGMLLLIIPFRGLRKNTNNIAHNMGTSVRVCVMFRLVPRFPVTRELWILTVPRKSQFVIRISGNGLGSGLSQETVPLMVDPQRILIWRSGRFSAAFDLENN